MITITSMAAEETRWTKQLKTVMNIVYESSVPLTADEVYSQARQKIDNISLGTVYRNLNKLCSIGVLSETHNGSVHTFLKHPFQNATFVCEKCRKMSCVPIELNTFQMEREIGMQVKKWNLQIVGVCKECEDPRT